MLIQEILIAFSGSQKGNVLLAKSEEQQTAIDFRGWAHQDTKPRKVNIK